MQILCTHVLLFFRFRSREITAGGRQMPPILYSGRVTLSSRGATKHEPMFHLSALSDIHRSYLLGSILRLIT